VKPTRQPVEYSWTRGPAFLRYPFDRELEIELLTYLDADLLFFGDPTSWCRTRVRSASS
jgi:hypothetical protein